MTSISIYVTEIATCTCMPRYKHIFQSIGKQQTHSELKTLSFLLKSKFYLHSAISYYYKTVFFKIENTWNCCFLSKRRDKITKNYKILIFIPCSKSTTLLLQILDEYFRQNEHRVAPFYIILKTNECKK